MATDEKASDIKKDFMEVHHHSHTPRKKWTHYFWEFFMLFLAVFCGFLAEYGLEHKIEANREKQYARSMVADLILDTTALKDIIWKRTKRIELLDTLFLLLKQPGDSSNLRKLYAHAWRAAGIRYIQFVYNDGTIQQLKNSGSLRLLRNKIVSKSIMVYDRNVRQLENSHDREEWALRDLKLYRVKIFDGRIYEAMLGDDDVMRRPPGNYALLQYTKDDLDAYIGHLFNLKAINIGYKISAKDLYNDAVNTINTIKKEYHLK